jgi:hypothetical protein
MNLPTPSRSQVHQSVRLPQTFGLALALCVIGNSAGGQPDPVSSVKLGLPIDCVLGQTCEIQNYVDRDPSTSSKDYMCGSNSYEAHSGVDFRIPDMAAQRRGVAVVAAAAGRVLRVRDGVADVSVKTLSPGSVSGRECGNGLVIDHGGGLTTQYCHMAKGSISVQSGTQVRAGEKLGLVGLSGNTEYPHLHFTVRRGDTVVDPFAPAAGTGATCGGGQSMWQDRLGPSIGYKAGTIINAGFASGPVTMGLVEQGGIASPDAASGAIIAYVRAINLRAGDVQEFTLRAPNGAFLAKHTAPPLSASQAQRLLFIGKNRPQTGWLRGRYVAKYGVVRGGRTIMQREFDLRL